MLEDLEFRRKALDLANFRAKLVEDLSEQAQAEGDIDETGPVMRLGRTIERYDGAGMFRETDFIRVSNAFIRQFGKALPVSAKGDTALHRSLGFDHRGRVDIALNPDQREGAWLRAISRERKFRTTRSVPPSAAKPPLRTFILDLRAHVTASLTESMARTQSAGPHFC